MDHDGQRRLRAIQGVRAAVSHSRWFLILALALLGVNRAFFGGERIRPSLCQQHVDSVGLHSIFDFISGRFEAAATCADRMRGGLIMPISPLFLPRMSWA